MGRKKKTCLERAERVPVKDPDTAHVGLQLVLDLGPHGHDRLAVGPQRRLPVQPHQIQLVQTEHTVGGAAQLVDAAVHVEGGVFVRGHHAAHLVPVPGGGGPPGGLHLDPGQPAHRHLQTGQVGERPGQHPGQHLGSERPGQHLSGERLVGQRPGGQRPDGERPGGEHPGVRRPGGERPGVVSVVRVVSIPVSGDCGDNVGRGAGVDSSVAYQRMTRRVGGAHHPEVVAHEVVAAAVQVDEIAVHGHGGTLLKQHPTLQWRNETAYQGLDKITKKTHESGVTLTYSRPGAGSFPLRLTDLCFNNGLVFCRDPHTVAALPGGGWARCLPVQVVVPLPRPVPAKQAHRVRRHHLEAANVNALVSLQFAGAAAAAAAPARVVTAHAL
eukprot:548082-Prorocentrum_minimum.AAC.1